MFFSYYHNIIPKKKEIFEFLSFADIDQDYIKMLKFDDKKKLDCNARKNK